MQVLLVALSPIIFGLMSIILWTIAYWIIRKFRIKAKISIWTHIIATQLVIIFIAYPSIINSTFSMFNCVKLNDNQ